MKYFLLLVLLGINSVSGQTLKKLKLNDTIYVLFDKEEHLGELQLQKVEYPNEWIYMYKYPNNKTVNFSVRTKDSKDGVCKKKKFLENKTTININDFNEMKPSDIIFELDSKKIKIFIIDRTETKKRKIYLREAIMYNSVPIEI